VATSIIFISSTFVNSIKNIFLIKLFKSYF
jgi:hypothetical protein